MSDMPKLTDAEAAVLRLRCAVFPESGATVLTDHLDKLYRSGLLISEDSKPTDLGRAALAAYDAQKRAEILAPALELLRRVEQCVASANEHTTYVEIPIDEFTAIRALLAKEGR